MKRSLIFVLCAVLAAALCGCKAAGDDHGSGIDAKPDSAQEETVTYSVETIKSFGASASSVWELLQDLLPNYIVYRSSSGSYSYADIDRSLPQSDYDWSNLVEVSSEPREVVYMEDGEAASLKGIDVSTYQGDIEWDKVAAAGVKFAFVRLGYRGYETGKLVKDDRFDLNMRGALENGVAVGVYFVTQAVDEAEAVEEAEFIMEAIAPYKVTWPVVLDIEDAASANARGTLITRDVRTDNVIAWCEAIKDGGYTPMLYCNIRWFIERLDIARIAEYDKWFAQYFRKPFFPYAFQVWQYSSSGRIDGIKGDVDFNISFVDYSNRREQGE